VSNKQPEAESSGDPTSSSPIGNDGNNGNNGNDGGKDDDCNDGNNGNDSSYLRLVAVMAQQLKKQIERTIMFLLQGKVQQWLQRGHICSCCDGGRGPFLCLAVCMCVCLQEQRGE